MLLHVNPSSGVPVYLQIQGQVKHAVAAGALKQDDTRAYQELEREGVIRTVPGGGTFVADGQPGLMKVEKVRRLRPVARQLAVEGTQMRLGQEEIQKLLKDELDQLGGKR